MLLSASESLIQFFDLIQHLVVVYSGICIVFLTKEIVTELDHFGLQIQKELIQAKKKEVVSWIITLVFTLYLIQFSNS